MLLTTPSRGDRNRCDRTSLIIEDWLRFVVDGDQHSQHVGRDVDVDIGLGFGCHGERSENWNRSGLRGISLSPNVRIPTLSAIFQLRAIFRPTAYLIGRA